MKVKKPQKLYLLIHTSFIGEVPITIDYSLHSSERNAEAAAQRRVKGHARAYGVAKPQWRTWHCDTKGAGSFIIKPLDVPLRYAIKRIR